MRQPLSDRTLNSIAYVTGLLGATTLIVALLLEPLGPGDYGALALLAAISWSLVHFPYRMGAQRQTTVEELGLCLALFLFPHSVLVPGIVGGYLASSAMRRPASWRVLFNAGIRSVAGLAALYLVRAIGFHEFALPAQMAVAFAAAGVYLFLADIAVSALWSLRNATSFRHSLRHSLALGFGPWFVASSSGVLIGIAAEATPWVFPLGVASAGFIIYGSHRRYIYREEGRRLKSLHAAGAALDTAVDEGVVETEAARVVEELLDIEGATIRTAPPGQNEHGLTLDRVGKWLIVPERKHIPISAEDRDTLATLATMVDSVLDRIELLAKLERQSLEDSLTRAGNRRHFDQALARLTFEKDEPLSLMVFDCDDFKQINDEYGHEAGDLALVELANAVVASFRPEDQLFRIGGDEFVLLLPGLEAQQAAERMRAMQARVARRDADAGMPRALVSAGVAGFPVAAADGASLFRYADSALYEAKRRGGNRVVVAGPGGAFLEEARSDGGRPAVEASEAASAD